MIYLNNQSPPLFDVSRPDSTNVFNQSAGFIQKPHEGTHTRFSIKLRVPILRSMTRRFLTHLADGICPQTKAIKLFTVQFEDEAAEDENDGGPSHPLAGLEAPAPAPQ